MRQLKFHTLLGRGIPARKGKDGAVLTEWPRGGQPQPNPTAGMGLFRGRPAQADHAGTVFLDEQIQCGHSLGRLLIEETGVGRN